MGTRCKQRLYLRKRESPPDIAFLINVIDEARILLTTLEIALRRKRHLYDDNDTMGVGMWC